MTGVRPCGCTGPASWRRRASPPASGGRLDQRAAARDGPRPPRPRARPAGMVSACAEAGDFRTAGPRLAVLGAQAVPDAPQAPAAFAGTPGLGLGKAVPGPAVRSGWGPGRNPDFVRPAKACRAAVIRLPPATVPRPLVAGTRRGPVARPAAGPGRVVPPRMGFPAAPGMCHLLSPLGGDCGHGLHMAPQPRRLARRSRRCGIEGRFRRQG